MKVAVIHFSLNFVGGAEKLCLTTISALKSVGHSVTLITVERTDWATVQKNFAEYTMPDRELFLFSAKLSKRLSNPAWAVTLFAGYLSQHIFLKMSGKYDVILSTFGDLIYSMVDVVYVNAPLKASDKFSQILPITNPSKWRFQSKLYDLSLMGFNKIPARIMLVNSTFIKQIVADCLETGSMVLAPPVDVNYFLPSNKNHRRKDKIVTLSGYSPKRHLERVPAIASLSKSGQFVIIGKTDAYSFTTIQNLTSAIKRCRLNDRVQLLQNLSRPELRKELSRAKICLHTMPNEHFGTAIIESMASGCIPIVDKSGGPWLDILEQKQGEYGYAYETLEEASEFIDQLLRDEDLRKEIASRATARSLNYDASIFSRKIVRIVELASELKRQRRKIDPYDIVTPDCKLRLSRDLEELQTDVAKASSANAYSWIKKGNITKELAEGSSRVLDIGCGWGRELARLDKAIGIDICLPFLKAAKNYTGNDVVLASTTYLPFKENAFDFLVISEVIEHLVEHEAAMKEAVRVLQNKGGIALQTPNRQITRQRAVAEGYGHVHEFNPKELFRFLTNFGFRELERFGSTIPYIPSGSRFSAYNGNRIFFSVWRVLDRLFPLKWDIIVSARLFKTQNTAETS